MPIENEREMDFTRAEVATWLDIAKQVSAAEDFMAKGVDVLIITPVNEEGVVPLLRRARRDRGGA